MAQRLKLKNSSVAGKAPVVGDLEYGELALNYTDGLLFYKKSDNTIQSISGSGSGGGLGVTNRTILEATATNGQTTFSIAGGYTVGYIDVFLNGIYLDSSAYTATNETTVVLSAGATAGDLLRFVKYSALSTSTESYTTAQVDGFLATKTTLTDAKNITVTNINSAYTIIASDLGKLINCTSGTFTVSLTSAATLGNKFNCYIKNSGTGTITIDPNSSETIDGLATIALIANESVQISCNGTSWSSISKVQTITQLSGETTTNITKLGLEAGLNTLSNRAGNTFIGYQAGKTNVSGRYGIAIGQGALLSATGDLTNPADPFLGTIAIGVNTALNQTTGTYNTYIGSSSATGNTTESRNVFIGWAAGALNNLNQSVVLGAFAESWNFGTATNRITIGYSAEPSSSTASNEITLGNGSITTFRIPGLGINWTSSNVPVKDPNITIGTGNFANIKIGENAGNALTTGELNVLIGTNAGSNISPNARTGLALGISALRYGVGYTSGSFNYLYSTAIGTLSLTNMSTGSRNTALGYSSGNWLETGNDNLMLGYGAGGFLGADSSQNTVIGSSAASNNTVGTNNIIVGYLAQTATTTASNEIVLGNSNNTRFRIPGLGIDWTASSVPSQSVPTVVLRVITVNASPTTLTTDGAAVVANNSCIISASSGYTYTIYLTAIQKVSEGNILSSWEFKGAIRRDVAASSVALASSIATTVINNDSDLSVQIGADPSFGSLSIIVTGKLNTNISWTATIQLHGSTYA